MNQQKTNPIQPVNRNRRKVMQGAALVGIASFAPTILGATLSNKPETTLSGELVCSTFNPVKTLVLKNNSDKAVVIHDIAQGAFMFDGSILDCNAACLKQPITIAANQEVHVPFTKAAQFSLAHKVTDYRRVQSQVTRLGDGTRVIPFTAVLQVNVATIA